MGVLQQEAAGSGLLVGLFWLAIGGLLTAGRMGRS